MRSTTIRKELQHFNLRRVWKERSARCAISRKRSASGRATSSAGRWITRMYCATSRRWQGTCGVWCPRHDRQPTYLLTASVVRSKRRGKAMVIHAQEPLVRCSRGHAAIGIRRHSRVMVCAQGHEIEPASASQPMRDQLTIDAVQYRSGPRVSFWRRFWTKIRGL